MLGFSTVNGLWIIVTPLRFFLGLILIAASLEKLRNISSFVEGVKQYKVLPATLNQLYAYTLPWIELLLGILFLTGFALKLAAILSICIFLSFAVAVTINLVRQRSIPCYCFGADANDRMGLHTLVRIVLLLISSIAIYLAPSFSDPWRFLTSPFSKIQFSELFPIVVLTVFGILILSLVEVSPWVIKAWLAPSIRNSKHTYSVVWSREPNMQEERIEEI